MTLDADTLSCPETFHWLLLQRLPGLGAAMLSRLIRGGDGSAADWLGWSPDRLAARGLNPAALASFAEWRRLGMNCEAARLARRDLLWMEQRGVRLIHALHPAYPPLLREIPDPPPCLYIWGDAEILSRPQLALVGSRHPTRQGLIDAESFAGALVGAGFVVTSGLAYGIDAAAHRAALASDGKTIAVLGSGLDVIYPASNQPLAQAICEQGAVITEFPLGTPPRARHFPKRNRIISGLSLGVLVVEATLRSGSLVTARLALEQNREVFALPGSIHNPASRGCNTLIRNGAKLVIEVRDILDELGGWSRAPADGAALGASATVPLVLSAEQRVVLEAIGYEPGSLDRILEAVPFAVSQVLAVLSELELKGLLENRAGLWQRNQP